MKELLRVFYPHKFTPNGVVDVKVGLCEYCGGKLFNVGLDDINCQRCGAPENWQADNLAVNKVVEHMGFDKKHLAKFAKVGVDTVRQYCRSAPLETTKFHRRFKIYLRNRL